MTDTERFRLPEPAQGEIKRLEHNEEYAPFLVLRNGTWCVYLHTDQRYLGRAYAWRTLHTDMSRLSRMSPDVWQYLQELLQTYEAALERLWQPDHINYAWLGNDFVNHRGHGHLHIIPRYASARRFALRNYVDENWGGNYAPYHSYRPSEMERHAICNALRADIEAH